MLAGGPLAGLAFLVAFPLVTLGSTAVLSWAVAGRLRPPVTLTFDADGVATSDGPDVLPTGSLDWSKFRRLEHTGGLYLLRLARGPGRVIVPRRGFVSAADDATFVRLATDEIGRSDQGSQDVPARD